MADLTAINQIVISAKDDTGSAFSSVEANLKSLSRQVTSITSGVEKLASAAGIALSFDGIVTWAGKVTEAAAQLERLTVITGSSVESLSRLSNVALYASVSFDTVQKLTERLGAVMGGFATHSAQAQKALELLGISTQDPVEGLQQLADKLNQYSDGANKLGLVTAILGRGAATVLPLLKEMAEAHEIAATTSTDQAVAAENLQKQIALLEIHMGTFKNLLLSDVVPALLEATTNFNLAQKAGLSFFQSLAISGVDGANVGILIDAMRTKVGDLQTRLDEAKKANQASPYIFGPTVRQDIIDTSASIDEAAKKLKVFEEIQAQYILNRPGLSGPATYDARDYMAQARPSAPNIGDATAAVDPFIKAMESAQKVITDANIALGDFGKTAEQQTSPAMKSLIDLLGSEEFAKFNSKQQAAITDAYLEADAIQRTTASLKAASDQQTKFNALVDQISGKAVDFSKEWAAQFQILVDEFNAGGISLDRFRELTQQLVDQQPFAKLAQQTQAEIAKMNGEYQKFLDKINESAAKQKLEIDLLGKAPDEIARAKAEFEAQAQVQLQINDLTVKWGEAIGKGNVPLANQILANLNDVLSRQGQIVSSAGDVAVAYQKAGEQVGAWKSIFSSLESEGATFIENFVTKGSSAFKTLWNDFKTWALKAFAEIAAQKIIISIAGSLGLGGVATQAIGSTNPLGTLLQGGQSANSIFGGGGIGSSALNFLGLGGTSFGAAATAGFSAGLDTLGIAMTAGAEAVGGFSAVLGAAIPVIGPIVAIGALIAGSGLFGHKGGPKDGGYATTGIDVGTQQTIAGLSGSRYFTPNTADSQLQTTIAGIAQSYLTTALSLGIKTGAAQFALGYDTDPKGSANSRVSAGASVGGVSVYSSTNVNAGRDDASLQAALSLEASRAVFAALKASDLPKYLATLFTGVDAATATADQITKIIATAQALKLAVDTVSSLGPQFDKMNPDQIQSLVSAFGSLANFTSSIQFINANFTTSAQKAIDAQAALTKGFDALGIAVPASHQAFLDLLSSFDLTTDAGQKLYAGVSALAPLFVQVAGTADQAAQALQKQIDSAQQFFNQNFFTSAEQQASKLAADTKQLDDAQTALGVSIPRTIDGFRSMVLGIDQSTVAGKKLYDALIMLAPAVFDLGSAAQTAAQQVTDAVNNISHPVDVNQYLAGVTTNIANIAALAQQGTGDFGSKLATEINLLGAAISKTQDQIAAATSIGDYSKITYLLNPQLKAYEAANAKAVDELARFTVLSAQYDAARAEQLVGLEDWYAAQKKLFAGQSDVLAALATIYGEKWKAIVDGVSTGVNGTLDQLAKLKQGIADYLKGLQVSDISPLTPTEKLAQAKSAYEVDLTKALGGDQTALGDVTKYADTYLKLARDYYASSGAFVDIFNQVTGQLGSVAGSTPQGGLLNTTDTSIASALPINGGKIASSADLTALGASLTKVLTDLITSLSETGTTNTDVLVGELQATQTAITDAVSGAVLQ